MRVKLTLVLLLTWTFAQAGSRRLQAVSDDDLLLLIREKEKLIVFFSKPDCPPCKAFEKQLEGINEDFEKQLNAYTVKAENSHLARLYNPAKEPALVFFRHGIPLLYSGEPNENEIYSFFEQNQSPAVKELTDKIFEHITQAATGATTGDWFVMFYGASCVECQRLHAVWEGVGAKLRSRINVARIDANVAGANTAKRFHVTKLPAFIFFRHGKMYRYELPKSDVKSFETFALDWYKNAKAENVPLLSSPFDELVDWCVEFLKHWIAFGLEILEHHPWIWQAAIVGVIGFSLVFITGAIAYVKARSRPTKQKKEKSK